MRSFLLKALAIGCWAVNASAIAEVPDELLETPLADMFGAAPTIGRPELSPDGSSMIFLETTEQGSTLLRALDFETWALTAVLDGDADGINIEWCQWVNSSRLICKLGPGASRSDLFGGAGFIALDSDGSNYLVLRHMCGSDTNRLPSDPDHVLVLCGRIANRINVYTGETKSTQGAPDYPAMMDGHGLLRLSRQSFSRGVQRWFARADARDNWTLIHEADLRALEHPLNPVGFGENPNEVFHLAAHGGRWALFAMNVADGNFESRLIFSHSILDVEYVDILGVDDRIVAATYLDGRPRRHFVDDRVEAIHNAASAALPGKRIGIVDESWDRNVYLLLAHERRRAGHLYRFDTTMNRIEYISPAHAPLEGFELAETHTVTMPGQDGGGISAHLTLPDESDSPMPVVIIPRGVPQALAAYDPHYLVQFLAARGYAVLRINQRGAEELGDVWSPASAIAGWKRGADDVNAAVTYLVSEGIAERGAICSLGMDFGAYAALLHSIEYPDDVNCIIGINVVVDPRDYFVPQVEEVGREFGDGSLLRRAEELTHAILLVGRYDDRWSVNLQSVLQKAGKDSVLVEYAYSDEAFSHPPHRTDMLTRIGQFLEDRINR